MGGRRRGGNVGWEGLAGGGGWGAAAEAGLVHQPGLVSVCPAAVASPHPLPHSLHLPLLQLQHRPLILLGSEAGHTTTPRQQTVTAVALAVHTGGRLAATEAGPIRHTTPCHASTSTGNIPWQWHLHPKRTKDKKTRPQPFGSDGAVISTPPPGATVCKCTGVGEKLVTLPLCRKAESLWCKALLEPLTA